LWVGDGKKLALLLTPLWGAMTWLFAFSFLLPLTFFDAPRIKSTGMTWIRGCLRAVAGLFPLPFLRSFFPVLAGSVLLTAVGFLAWLFPLLWIPLIFLASPGSRFKRSDWVLRAGLGAGLLFFVLFKGWTTFQFQWTGLYDLLVHGRYIAFFLLGWLGLLAFPRQGTARYILFPMFLLVLGFLFWPGHSLVDPLEMGILKWVLVFCAGFGLESLRRDLMDPTWHGRLVWLALGAAFFGGVV
jgi:hypothetical protein